MEDEKRKTENGRPDSNKFQAIELAIAHELEARKGYLALAGETDDAELKSLLRRSPQRRRAMRLPSGAGCGGAPFSCFVVIPKGS